MRLLRGLLDRLLLVAAIVAGGLLPGFISQYRQRLGGRLDQAQIDLQAWQGIADRYHQGDIEKLIAYHLKSGDPTFHSEGQIIRQLVDTVQQLQNAVESLRGSVFHQAAYLARHLDMSLASATFGDWVPTFSLSMDGLLFAGLFAAVVWLLFQALWGLVAGAATGRVFGRKSRQYSAAR